MTARISSWFELWTGRMFGSLKLIKKITADHCCDKRASGSSLTMCRSAASAQPLALINILPFFVPRFKLCTQQCVILFTTQTQRQPCSLTLTPHTRTLTLSSQPHALGCCDWEGCCQLREYESGRMTSLLFTGIRSSLAAPPPPPAPPTLASNHIDAAQPLTRLVMSNTHLTVCFPHSGDLTHVTRSFEL